MASGSIILHFCYGRCVAIYGAAWWRLVSGVGRCLFLRWTETERIDPKLFTIAGVR